MEESKRDRFAGLAMQVFLADAMNRGYVNYEDISESAFKLADAMVIKGAEPKQPEA